MLSLRQLIKRVPGLGFLCHYLHSKYAMSTVKGKSADVIFTEIFHGNKFGGTQSASGPGSDIYQTRVVRNALPAVIDDCDIRTMLDIPCGDFHWMKHVSLESVDYIGADIVEDLIQQNKKCETSNVHFCQLNLIEDLLPRVDLVFSRDCFVHLSFRDTALALHNICQSGSIYLLTTTFTSCHSNRDIATGQWRPLNLQNAPFHFPPPLRVINEGCTENDGRYSDKSLGLWKVADIEKCLGRRSN